MTLRVLADRWFDGARLRDDPVWIELEGDAVAAIRPGLPEDPPGAPVLDARGLLVAPGLINAHVHLARGGMFEPVEPLSLRQVVSNMRATLAAGVTTVGDMGCAAALARAMRDHARAEPGACPSVVACGPVVTAPAGYPLNWMPASAKRIGGVVTVAAEAEARRAAQTVADLGLDHVKVMLMHESYAGASLDVPSLPVVKALVDEAHRLGLRAYAHAMSPADYRLALDAGVDALMHSSFEPLDRELVARVKDAGVTVTPTLWVFESACLGPEGCFHREPRYQRLVTRGIAKDWQRYHEAYAASGDVVPPGIATGLTKAKAKEKVRVAAANLRLLREAGVPIAFGNDAAFGFCLHGRPIDELTAMERAGLSALEVLRAATSSAADLLGRADRGRLEPGKRADLVLLDPAAATRVSALDQVRGVIAAGRPLDTHPLRMLGEAARSARASVGGVARTLLTALRGGL
jgi:imidazolonepropionase-like amidohydrolase